MTFSGRLLGRCSEEEEGGKECIRLYAFRKWASYHFLLKTGDVFMPHASLTQSPCIVGWCISFCVRIRWRLAFEHVALTTLGGTK